MFREQYTWLAESRESQIPIMHAENGVKLLNGLKHLRHSIMNNDKACFTPVTAKLCVEKKKKMMDHWHLKGRWPAWYWALSYQNFNRYLIIWNPQTVTMVVLSLKPVPRLLWKIFKLLKMCNWLSMAIFASNLLLLSIRLNHQLQADIWHP